MARDFRVGFNRTIETGTDLEREGRIAPSRAPFLLSLPPFLSLSFEPREFLSDVSLLRGFPFRSPSIDDGPPPSWFRAEGGPVDERTTRVPGSADLRRGSRRCSWLVSLGLAWIGKKEGGKERFKSGVKGSASVADTGLAPDCIYSSTKRFTFTKSFQLHGARRISTLLSSFGDVILLAAMAGGCKRRLRSRLLPISLSRTRGLSLFLSLSHANDFKVVAGNRFANPWRRRIGPFPTPAPRFHFVHHPHSTLSLSASRYL